MRVHRFIKSDRRDTRQQETYFHFLWALGTTSNDRNLQQHLFQMFMFISFCFLLPIPFSPVGLLKIYLVQFLFIHCKTYMYLHFIYQNIFRDYILVNAKHNFLFTVFITYFVPRLFLLFNGLIKILREGV